jgi:hypothetical protein
MKQDLGRAGNTLAKGGRDVGQTICRENFEAVGHEMPVVNDDNLQYLPSRIDFQIVA